MKLNNKKIVLILTISLFSKTGLTERIDIEKIVNENSIVFKGLNKIGINPFEIGKEFKKKIDEPEKKKAWNEPEKSKIWVEGKSLKECMGKDKMLNNNTIQCHNGYFKID